MEQGERERGKSIIMYQAYFFFTEKIFILYMISSNIENVYTMVYLIIKELYHSIVERGDRDKEKGRERNRLDIQQRYPAWFWMLMMYYIVR